MIRAARSWATIVTDDERYRPLYARVLGLRVVNPGGVLCFLFFEGAVALAALLALAELVSWWAVLVLPAVVAAMVKLNDLVAERVIRTASLVPEQERDRFRRQIEPVIGRARVPSTARPLPGAAHLGGPAVPAAAGSGFPAVPSVAGSGGPAVPGPDDPGTPPRDPDAEERSPDRRAEPDG